MGGKGTGWPVAPSYVRHRLVDETEVDMRRVLATLIGISVAVSLGAPTAQAVAPHREKYQSWWVNAFWHSKVKVDPDTYLKITWYAGAYDNGEEGFWSDLYRSVERCQVRDGGDRCRSVRSMSWYGDTTDRQSSSFTLDRRMDSGHLDATYRLFRRVDGEQVLVGRFHVVTDLTGRGDLVRGRSSYSEHQGCTTIKYSGRYQRREATATGTLARGDAAARSLGRTADANFGANQSVEIQHSC
jgi:hypothetical protein